MSDDPDHIWPEPPDPGDETGLAVYWDERIAGDGPERVQPDAVLPPPPERPRIMDAFEEFIQPSFDRIKDSPQFRRFTAIETTAVDVSSGPPLPGYPYPPTQLTEREHNHE